VDRAIKAEWYDLANEDRESFLNWLHGDYAPRLQSRPGHIWVGHYDRAPRPSAPPEPGRPSIVETDDPDVARGSQYLLVIAAATPDVFFDANNPLSEDADAVRMLARRKQCRQAVFVEETRVNGPDWYSHIPGSGAPPAIQLGNFRTSSESDDWELSVWYRQLKLPQVTRTRGCIGARKLISIVGWPKHGILYEFTGMDEGEPNFEKRMRDTGFDGNWQGRHVLGYAIHSPTGPHAGRRIWPPR
jgi:hypothetical protein